MDKALSDADLDDLAARCSAPIIWGETDCAPLVCDHLYDITGDDLMQGFRTYRTEADRDALLAAHGGLARIVLGVMRGRNRWCRVAPADCHYPGLGLAVFPGGLATVCLAMGAGFFVTRASRGVSVLRDVNRAWTWV